MLNNIAIIWFVLFFIKYSLAYELLCDSNVFSGTENMFQRNNIKGFRAIITFRLNIKQNASVFRKRATKIHNILAIFSVIILIGMLLIVIVEA